MNTETSIITAPIANFPAMPDPIADSSRTDTDLSSVETPDSEKPKRPHVPDPIHVGEKALQPMGIDELEAHIKELHDASQTGFMGYARNRYQLGTALAFAHAQLAKRGCKGEWTPFLLRVGIPSRSADRLIQAYKIYRLAPHSLCLRAFEVRVDLMEPAVSRTLEKIVAEYKGVDPTTDELEALLERLEGASKKRQHQQQKRQRSPEEKVTRNAIFSKILQLKVASPQDRPDQLRELVLQVAAIIGERDEYDVLITRRSARHGSEPSTDSE